MTPAEYNIVLYEGTTYNLSLTWKDDNDLPVDLTNWEAKMHIRNTVESVSYLDCTPYFTLGGANGIISLELPPSFIVDIGFKTGVYDIDLHKVSGLSDSAYSDSITPSATTGNITLTLSVGTWTRADVGKQVSMNSGTALITSYVSDTVVNATVETDFANTNTITSGNWNLYTPITERLMLGKITIIDEVTRT